ncbi:SbcC/MukB-like Walker B domain-containing protein [Streptomyces flavidovirens]|uniref:SbcC/MukB-like Walker B domain-containing protein n=1 Tax=Streptomyces flavidovirens TaxID=67298 RepID=A0ABW6R8N4_9ACTN
MNSPSRTNHDLTAFASRLSQPGSTTPIDPHPGVRGRWQPTRCGVVNSWKWANEQFFYGSGWLAMVGSNGSGKSLTGATFCPTLIDGDVSQRSLSASGLSAGTLHSTHTLGHSGPPKVGVWWQEYGFTPGDGDDDQETRWLTVGMWLRSRGGTNSTVDRAWFIVPTRVGIGLVLERDRSPVSIEDLAQQLAQHDGQLFTSEQMAKGARKHLTVVADESSFAEAIRATLYEPLDADQVDALTTVLRALRSVQANDKVSPTYMQSTLTSALPALDGIKVKRLAEALAKTEQLQTRLGSAKSEHAVLSKIASAYRRYARAVAVRASAYLLERDSTVQQLARSEASLKRQLRQQEETHRSASSAAEELREEIDRLGATVGMLQLKVDGHPGASLDRLGDEAERREQDAERYKVDAAEAEDRAEGTRQSSKEASEKAAEAARHLKALLGELRIQAEEANAEAFHDRLKSVAAPLISHPSAQPPAATEADARAAKEVFQAWLDQRTVTIEKINKTLATLLAACKVRDDASDDYVELKQQAEIKEQEWDALGEKAEVVEDEARAEITRLISTFRYFSAPPEELLSSAPLRADALERWAEQSLRQALRTIDVEGRKAEVVGLDKLLAEALHRRHGVQTAARESARRCTDTLSDLNSRLLELIEPPQSFRELSDAVSQAAQLCSPERDLTGLDAAGSLEHVATLAGAAEQAVRGRRTQLQEAERLIREQGVARTKAQDSDDQANTAETEAHQAAQTLASAERAAEDAAVTWVSGVRQWAEELQELDRTRLRLPAHTPIGDADIDCLASDVSEARDTAITRLAATRTKAQDDATRLSGLLDDVDGRIIEAEQEMTGPDEPSWRPDRTGRSGAPLWALVEFAPGLDDELAGRLEGGLLAAGLLDAWVSSDGTWAEGDVHLVAGAPVDGPTLADLLVPDSDSSIPSDRVHALLTSIPLTAADALPKADVHTVVGVDGTVRSGVLSASSPTGWESQFIGAAARERARQLLLARLRNERENTAAQLREAEEAVQRAQASILRIKEESRYPDPAPLIEERRVAEQRSIEAKQLRDKATTARDVASEQTVFADQAELAAAEACEAARVLPDLDAIRVALNVCIDVPSLVERVLGAGRSAINTAAAVHEAVLQVREYEAQQAAAAVALAEARESAEAADAEHTALPPLDVVRKAQVDARTAEREARSATSAAERAKATLEERERGVTEARSQLSKVARTTDGRVLPTDPDLVDAYSTTITELRSRVSDWAEATARTLLLASDAAKQHTVVHDAEERARELVSRAQRERAEATKARHMYGEELRQHGLPYQQLVAELSTKRVDLARAKNRQGEELRKANEADKETVRVTERLNAQAEKFVAGQAALERSVAEVQSLFDRDLISELVSTGPLIRPDAAGEASDVARQVILQRGLDSSITPESAEREESSAFKEVGTRVQKIRLDLSRLSRDISLEDVPDTSWRRVVVTERTQAVGGLSSEVASTKPLRSALDDLGRSIETLESDFDEQVRTEVKGAILTDLRKHIQVRIQLAKEIVSGITSTLATVRTGVARVGVKLGWEPNESDPVAREALALVQDLDTEGEFDRMYSFFVQQLLHEERTEASWPERVQNVFDYRSWFKWDISLTHTDFSEPGSPAEVFRTVSPRRNPLDKLSAGEKRLATMLPLLAAARAFYEADGYVGPRMIFIDELNSALDEQNLRKLLALLRSWDFDVLVTLPSMQPLLVKETGAIGIHKIFHEGSSLRYAIPSIWSGHGAPATARISVGVQHLPRQGQHHAAAPGDGQDALFATRAEDVV